MCGIAGYIKLEGSPVKWEELSALKTALLMEIESRGKDATGALSVRIGSKPSLLKGDVDAKGFTIREEGKKFLAEKADICLLHTRAATSGKADNNENNHPLAHGGVVVVHNGIIWNDDELKKEFKLEKIEVDSIVIPAQIAASRMGKTLKDGIQGACEKIGGSMACGVWDSMFPKTLAIFSNGGSPLNAGYSKELGLVVFGSTISAINVATDKVFGSQLNGTFSKFSYRRVDKGALEISTSGEVLSYDCSDGPTRTWTSTPQGNQTDYWQSRWGDSVDGWDPNRFNTMSPGIPADDPNVGAGRKEWKKFRKAVHAMCRKNSKEESKKAKEYIDMIGKACSADSIGGGAKSKWGIYSMLLDNGQGLSNMYSPDDYFYVVVKEGEGYAAKLVWEPIMGNLYVGELFAQSVAVLDCMLPLHPNVIAASERDHYVAIMAGVNVLNAIE